MLFWFLKKIHDFFVINANGIRFHMFEAFFQPTCYGGLGVYFTNDKMTLLAADAFLRHGGYLGYNLKILQPIRSKSQCFGSGSRYGGSVIKWPPRSGSIILNDGSGSQFQRYSRNFVLIIHKI
jgi:hypothetical protein